MIAAAAAAVALAAPSREALIERWLHGNRAHAAARLEPAATARKAAPAPPDLRGLAQRELGIAGRYHLGPPPAAAEPWWAPAWRWIVERWNRFWQAIFARAHVGKEAATSIGDALLAVVALLLLVTVVRLLRNVQFSRSASQANSQPLGARPDPLPLYRDACDAANRGDFGNAALLLFTATVALLDGRGAFAAHRSATVGDLRRALRAGNAALIAPFDAVATPFVQKAYAERAVDEPQWQRARTAFAEINAQCHPDPVVRHPEPVEG